MPVVTLRPDGTVDNPWTVTGAATAHEALSDDADSSYLLGQASLTGSTFTLGDPTFPASARVVACRMRLRWRSDSGGSVNVGLRLRVGTEATYAQSGSSTISSTTYEELVGNWLAERPGGGSWSFDDIGSLRAAVSHGTGSFSRDAELYVDVEYNERPVGTLDPLDPVTNTSVPTLTWDYSDPEGDSQESFRVVLSEGSTEVYDSGWVISAVTSHRLPTLNNGSTYTAELQVRQQWGGVGTHESAVDTVVFTMDLDTPAAPDVLVVEYPDAGLVTLELADPTVAPSPVAEWFTVEYRDAGDDSWTVLRGADALPVTAPVLVTDYEAPLGVQRSYRIRGFTDAPGETVASDATEVAATLAATGRWITDPRDPDGLNVRVKTREHDRLWSGREVVHFPAGMDVAVVESEPPVFGQTLSVWSLDPAEHALLVGALTATRTLLYRDRRTTMYFRWHGDRTSRQFGPDATGADGLTGSMVEVSRPDGPFGSSAGSSVGYGGGY